MAGPWPTPSTGGCPGGTFPQQRGRAGLGGSERFKMRAHPGALTSPTSFFKIRGVIALQGLPWWLSGKESACHYRRLGFNPWIRKIPWRRRWQPTPVLLPEKCHGQRSLVGSSPQGWKETYTTEAIKHTSTRMYNWFTSLNT